MEVQLNLEKYRGKWYARGQDAYGEPIRSSLKMDASKPEKDALMALGEFRRSVVDNGGHKLVAGKTIVYQVLADLYLDKPNAKDDWRRKMKPSETKWGRTPITSIDEAAVLEWEEELLRGGLKPPTVKRYFNVFKAALVYGCKRLKLPMPMLPNIGSDGESRVVVVPNDVREKVLEAMPLDLRWYYITLAFTGTRPIELVKLKWMDVDMENSMLWVSSHKGKGGMPRRRAVTFPSEVRKVLLDIVNFFGIGNREDYVFKQLYGDAWATDFKQPVDAIRKRLYRACDAAGVASGVKGGLFSYAFRHTFASKVALSGVTNALMLAKHIGHKNTQTTSNHYVHSGITETESMVKGLR